MDENKLTLEFDDGEEVECEIMGTFDADGVEYIALYQKEADEVYIYRFIATDDGFELGDLSEEEFELAGKEFDAIMEQLEG